MQVSYSRNKLVAFLHIKGNFLHAQLDVRGFHLIAHNTMHPHIGRGARTPRTSHEQEILTQCILQWGKGRRFPSSGKLTYNNR